MSNPPMINYQQALEIIRGLALPVATERLPLEACSGRVLAEDLVARVPSPPYTNSAMDGFAVRRDEALKGPLTISATVYARALRESDIPPARAGACVRIMTGAYLPPWADTVIPVEQSVTDPDGRIRFTEIPELGQNIRRLGEDLAEGSPLMRRGALLGPERIMVAAAFGHGELTVEQRPDLHFLSTGDELVEIGEPLPPGAIYNSSKYFLLAAARQLGFATATHRTIPDDVAEAARLVTELTASGRPTVLVTTGAVSAGDLDFIPKLGTELGFQAQFHKVAIRPGKPVYLASKKSAIWLGLPGNPISTCVGWHIFARPLLAAVAAAPPPVKRTLVLQNEVRKPEGLRCFFRAEVTGNKAWVSKRQGSAQLAASITNEAYVELPEGLARVPADTRVDAFIV